MNPGLAFLMLATPGVHVRVDGDGYFRLARSGQPVYVREVTLVARNGTLGTEQGWVLLPQVRIPEGTAFTIDLDGNVNVGRGTVGHILLSSEFKNGRRSSGLPGEGVFGVIRCDGGAAPTPLPVSPVSHVSNVSRSSTTATPSAPKTANLRTAQIQVELLSEVADGMVHLGDIAKIDGEAGFAKELAGVELGAAPKVGARWEISASYVLTRLRFRGIATDGIQIYVPGGAKIVVKGQTVADDELLKAAVDRARDDLGITYALKNGALTAAPPLQVPSGTVSIRADRAVSNGSSGGAMVALTVLVNDQEVAHRTLTLSPDGEVPRVRAGESVKVRVARAGAVVETTGTARTGGLAGTTVSVALTGGATVNATVKENGLVEVNP